MLFRAHLAIARFELTTLVVIGTDCIGSYKSNYHTPTTGPSMLTEVMIIDIFLFINFCGFRG